MSDFVPDLEILDFRSKDGLTVKLVKDAGVLGEDEWSVTLSDSSGFVEKPCGDEYEARTQFRLLCTEIGIPMPYEAPRFETPIEVPADPTADAAAIYYAYHGQLGGLYPGSPDVAAVKAQAMADPDFVRLADQILALTPENSSNWIIATIRVCCKRIAAKVKDEEERELRAISTYGAF